MHDDSAFFIPQKIDRSGSRILFQDFTVCIQRMAAQINTKNFFFELQKNFLIKLSNIRHADHKGRSCFFLCNIKEAQLSADVTLFIAGNFIHDIHINMDQLFPGKAERVKCTCLDQILDSPFINIF